MKITSPEFKANSVDALNNKNLQKALTHVEKGFIGKRRKAADALPLITRHGGATVVADVISTVFAPPVARLIRENAKAKADYLEYRQDIEGLAAAKAAERATDEDKVILTRIIQDMRKAHEKHDAEREADLDVAFHNAIGDSAHNIVLLHTLRSCYRLLEEAVFFNRKLLYDGNGMREKLLEQHEAIYEAIIAGQNEAAAKAAQDHIAFLRDVSREENEANTRSAISALRLEQFNNRSKRSERKTRNDAGKAKK